MPVADRGPRTALLLPTLAISFGVAAIAACGRAPELAPVPATSPPPAPPPGRVVALGDLHADLDSALAALSLAGLVDAQGHWSGGAATLVQTGDTTDRGPDSKEVIELLMRLQAEAPTQGGQVLALLGNHEVMNMMGDWRYVSEPDLADFGGAEARRAAFSPQGELGRWLREQPAVARVGPLVFVHGGVSEGFASQGVEGLASAVRQAIDGVGPAGVLGPEGPLWYRGYLLAPEPLACAELERALALLGAERMVVGHTHQESGRIAARCGGRLLGIDTGISAHYGRKLSALELRGDDARALYPEGALDLPDP